MEYGDKSWRERRGEEIREWMNKQVEIIDSIPSNTLQALCYFSLIECFAQEYSNYPPNGKNAKAFCDYVIQFQKSYNFLEKIDPVTLFYDHEETIKEKYNLSFMSDGCYYFPNNLILRQHTNELVQLLSECGVTQSKINRHQYVRLLYSLRSKLSHEAASPSGIMCFKEHPLEDTPYYLSCSRHFYVENQVVDDNVWQLAMPVGFVKKIFLECTEGYLQYSFEHKKDPFENNSLNRKSALTWYDT